MTSDVAGVKVATAATADTKAGQETAIWDETGTTLTLNLSLNKVYTQAEIDDLIKNAKQEDSTANNSPANVTVTLKNGIFNADAAATAGEATVAGAKAKSGEGRVTGFVGADTIQFTANKYGKEFNDTKFTFAFDKEAGKEEIVATTAIAIDAVNKVTNGEYKLKVSANLFPESGCGSL